MLTITIDPDHPLDALEGCAALTRLLAETFTIPREAESFSEDAQNAASMIFAAVTDAQVALAEMLAERLRPAAVRLVGAAGPLVFQDDAGVLHRVPAATPLAPFSLPDAAPAATVREAPAPLSPSPTAPCLTEPRPTAARSRRAA